MTSGNLISSMDDAERDSSDYEASGSKPVRRVMLLTQSVAMGGMETHVRDLAVEYVRRGLAVSLVLPPGGEFDRIATACSNEGVAVSRLVTDRRHGVRAELSGLAKLAGTILRFKPEVVHLHTGGATGGLAPFTVTRLCSRAATVRTEHDVPTALPGRSFRATSWLTDRLTGGLVAVSRRNAHLRIARLRGHRRFSAVLNGVPTLPLDAALKQKNREAVLGELGVCATQTVVGSVVRLVDGKGLPDLVHAFSAIDATLPTHLLLVGDGPLRSALTDQVSRLGIADRVHFVGQRDNVTPYLDAMDVFVLAVPAGSMSIALLEAMARGVASVITFGGPEEAVIDGVTGRTAPPNNPAALAEVLAELVRDAELRERLAAAGFAHIREHLSAARVAGDLLQVYAAAKGAGLPPEFTVDALPSPAAPAETLSLTTPPSPSVNGPP